MTILCSNKQTGVKAEIRNSGQYKEEFITEYLIEAEENELIRVQMGMKPPE